MTEFKTDSTGQIIGVSHHDGHIRSVTFGADRQIVLGIRSSAGGDIEVRLLGVGYSVMNEVREGNIIDRMYLWRLGEAPGPSVRRMLEALRIDSVGILTSKFGPDVKVFQLDCSYGAEIFALVAEVRIDVGT